MKAFIDTNILLDWLLKDRPAKPFAEKILTASRLGLFDTYLSTQSIIDASYSAVKEGISFEDFKPRMQSLCSFVKILSIDYLDLLWAMEHYTGDFEDDAQWASAYNNVCDYFITRDKALLAFNTANFPLKVISPAAFVTAMEE